MRFAKTRHPERLWCDNIRFDALDEIPVYQGLKALQQVGEISELKYHTRFHFWWNDIWIADYETDFTYLDKSNKTHVIDVKGFKKNKRGELKPRLTEEFKIKRQLMLACFGITVEVL